MVEARIFLMPPEAGPFNQAATIAAISSPFGTGAIGIVRLSGPLALTILGKVFRPLKKTAAFLPRRLYLGQLLAPETGQPLDQVLAVYFKGPRSFTGEDLVEFQGHGGPQLMRLVLKAALAAGARPAEPGEFTRRAFTSGRLDLSQAEAVADLIAAQNETAARLALRQLEGGLGRRIKAVTAALLSQLSLIQAELDFPEEVDALSGPAELAAALRREALEPVRALLEAAEAGRWFRRGLQVVLAGRPNAGKSSLFNALLQEDRAIVTPLPGTTRDVLNTEIIWRGLRLELLDTAGLSAAAGDLAEAEGQRRAKASLRTADLALWVHDGRRPWAELEADVAASGLPRERLKIVINKLDLLRPGAWEKAAARPGLLGVSAKTGQGLEALKNMIVAALAEGGGGGIEAPEVAPNERHERALTQALEALQRALEALEAHRPGLDLAAVDLEEALRSLALITGENLGAPAVLEEIFSRFCLGK